MGQAHFLSIEANMPTMQPHIINDMSTLVTTHTQHVSMLPHSWCSILFMSLACTQPWIDVHAPNLDLVTVKIVRINQSCCHSNPLKHTLLCALFFEDVMGPSLRD